MYKRILQLFALVLICTGGVSVDPYQSFSTTITLRDANGNALTTNPTGKVYIWATDENDRVSDGLDVIELSLGSNVYMHQTSRQGVLIMDAAALIQSQRFNLTLDTKGTYELHALYMPTGTIDPNAVTNYWPYELSGNTVNDRTVTVDATPANDVAMMVVSTKIRGIGVDSFLISDPRNQTLSTAISVDSGSSATDVQLALLRDNGLSVGEGVPVYINTTSNQSTCVLISAPTSSTSTAAPSRSTPPPSSRMAAPTCHIAPSVNCSVQKSPTTATSAPSPPPSTTPCSP